MVRAGSSRTLGLIALAAGALASTGCTRGNIVADFERPMYTIVDTLSGGVEVRRYDGTARAGQVAAESATGGSAGEIEAAAARSGLIAVLTTSSDDPAGQQPGLTAALEASPRWQADGEPISRRGSSRFAFLGLDRNELAVPVRRLNDLSS